MWWLLWLVGILASLFLILYASFQIWVSTWQTYRNNEFGFSLRIPHGWDIKDPRKDTSDTQYVFDYGSILKIGDKATDFPMNKEGTYSYQGNLLIYIYQSNEKVTGTEIIKVADEGLSREFLIGDGRKAFDIDITVYRQHNFFEKLYLRLVEEFLIKSFSIK